MLSSMILPPVLFLLFLLLSQEIGAINLSSRKGRHGNNRRRLTDSVVTVSKDQKQDEQTTVVAPLSPTKSHHTHHQQQVHHNHRRTITQVSYATTSTNHATGTNSNACRDQDWQEIELFLPISLQSAHRINEWKDIFLHTYTTFWPIASSNTKLLIMIDHEDRNNSYIQDTMMKELQSYNVLQDRYRVIYNEIPGIYFDHFGWKRQQYMMMYPDNYTNAEYVGFVDTDCMFITYVHSSDIFEHGKPVINGKSGNPHKHGEKEEAIWQEIIATTYNITGLKEPMKCMSYWPVVIRTKHIKAFREFLESKYNGLPFYEIMRLYISKRWFGQFDMFCAYLFQYHHNDYTWYVHNISPDWSYDGAFDGMNTNHSIYTPEMFYAKPRIAIHARYHVPMVYPGGNDFNDILQVGLCFSPPFPKTSPLLQQYCSYYSTLQDYQERVFIDMYRFEKFGFYKSYSWIAIQQALYDRQQKLSHCSHSVEDKVLREIFNRPIIEEGEIIYTEITGQSLYMYQNKTFHGFGGWGAFVSRGLEEKPKRKLSPTVFYLIPQGEVYA